jgi:hypothetical protein
MQRSARAAVHAVVNNVQAIETTCNLCKVSPTQTPPEQRRALGLLVEEVTLEKRRVGSIPACHSAIHSRFVTC